MTVVGAIKPPAPSAVVMPGVRFDVQFIAPCPRCGVLCDWFGQQVPSGSGSAGTRYVQIDCRCE